MKAASMVSVEEATALLRQTVQPIAAVEQVALQQALGRVLATALNAPFDLPLRPTAAMDGYALSALSPAAPNTRYRVIGRALAGHPSQAELAPGTCVRIMTGALLPEGADRVVKQEDVRLEDGQIVLNCAVSALRHVRAAGEECRRGELVLAPGRVLGAQDLARIAMLGQDQLNVLRRLRVAFFSSGDEIRALGQPLDAGAVFDSNRQFLLAAVRASGAEAIDLGLIADRPAALEAAIAQAALQADLLITTGGASVGEADHMRAILQAQATAVFCQVRMKPGRPASLYTMARPNGHLPVLMLPGSPWAMMTVYTVLVRPTLHHAAGGAAWPVPQRLQARLTSALQAPSDRTDYIAAALEVAGPDLIATPLAKSRAPCAPNHAIPRGALDAFIELTGDGRQHAAGDLVNVVLLNPP